MQPNAVTCSALVDLCCTCGDMTRAESMLAFMQGSGHAPELNTFNMLLLLCCRRQQNDRVLRILGTMRSARVLPDAATMNILATGYAGDRAALELVLHGVPQMAPPSMQ